MLSIRPMMDAERMLAGHVPDGEGDPVAVQREDLVPVTADVHAAGGGQVTATSRPGIFGGASGSRASWRVSAMVCSRANVSIFAHPASIRRASSSITATSVSAKRGRPSSRPRTATPAGRRGGALTTMLSGQARCKMSVTFAATRPPPVIMALTPATSWVRAWAWAACIAPQSGMSIALSSSRIAAAVPSCGSSRPAPASTHRRHPTRWAASNMSWWPAATCRSIPSAATASSRSRPSSATSNARRIFWWTGAETVPSNFLEYKG